MECTHAKFKEFEPIKEIGNCLVVKVCMSCSMFRVELKNSELIKMEQDPLHNEINIELESV